MKTNIARGVSVCLLAFAGVAVTVAKSPDPVYNPSAEVRISAVITGVRQVPEGNPLAGLHVTVQPKNASPVDVYMGPTAFLKIFKTAFPVGAAIQVIGARSGDGILAREVTEGATSITLRELTGVPVWEHWGVIADGGASGD